MKNNKLTSLIQKYQEKIEDDVRDYIGASSIGSDCLRQIWYQLKGVKGEAIPTKFKRTWAIGNRLEGLIIEWVREAGIKVQTDSYTYTAQDMPYFQGHFDGIITYRKKKSILEIKTAKDASFKVFVNKGLKVWNTQYYAQVQSYMGMSRIYSAYILVLNKDNSDLFDEFVTFDSDYYEALKLKARMIYVSVEEPPRINSSPMFYKCKMCKFIKVCHK